MRCRKFRHIRAYLLRSVHHVKLRRTDIRNAEECPPADGQKNKIFLQAEKMNQSPLRSLLTGTRRTFLCILDRIWDRNLYGKESKRRASLSVEAAVVVPIFILTVSTILGILDIYRIQSAVKTSLHESAMELGMYAYAAQTGGESPAGIVSTAVCTAYAKSRMPDFGEYVKVSTVGSSYQGHRISLTARVTYKLPFSVIPLPAISFTNESCVNSWTGQDEGELADIAGGSQEEMVYVTDYESVYHTSAECTHLELAIHQGTLGTVEDIRNAYGQTYHCCDKCGKAPEGTWVYYTEKGDCYHTSESCSGLKRTVRLVKKSETYAAHQCERCEALS